MRVAVGRRRGPFFGRFVRNARVGPNLRVRVRIARAHLLAVVFENDHRVDVGQRTQFGVLLRPGHRGKRQRGRHQAGDANRG